MLCPPAVFGLRGPHGAAPGSNEPGQLRPRWKRPRVARPLSGLAALGLPRVRHDNAWLGAVGRRRSPYVVTPRPTLRDCLALKPPEGQFRLISRGIPARLNGLPIALK